MRVAFTFLHLLCCLWLLFHSVLLWWVGAPWISSLVYRTYCTVGHQWGIPEGHSGFCLPPEDAVIFYVAPLHVLQFRMQGSSALYWSGLQPFLVMTPLKDRHSLMSDRWENIHKGGEILVFIKSLHYCRQDTKSVFLFNQQYYSNLKTWFIQVLSAPLNALDYLGWECGIHCLLAHFGRAVSRLTALSDSR